MQKNEKRLLIEINKRIRIADQKNELVIYVKNVRKLKCGFISYDFADGLNVYSSYIIYKAKASIFSDNYLICLLHKINVSEIELIGIDGNRCVASSASDAR